MKTLNFNNYSMWVEKKHNYDWYEWCVFVNSPKELLDDIKTVEYTLHPTFPDPVRLIKDKATRFALLSAGWGGFQINAKAILVTGELIETNHNLKLGKDDWPRGTKLTNFDSTPERIIYENLFHEKYRWRKASTLAKAAEV